MTYQDGGGVNPYKKLVISLFGLILAVMVCLEIQILYTGEAVRIVTVQSSSGTEYTLYLREGALAIWKIVGNGLWMLLTAGAAFIWAIPRKQK